MADPRPVLRVTGAVRAAETFNLVDQATGEARLAGRLNVLTDDGGFISVYVGPELVKNTQFDKGDKIDTNVEVYVRRVPRRNNAGDITGWSSELQAALIEAPGPSAV